MRGLINILLMCFLFSLTLIFSIPSIAKEDKNKTGAKMIHGFKLLQTQKIKEVDGTAYIYSHEKTGARLLYLANNDDNKVFAISFRTIPHDNTGVPHILEHSVLCGSKKFPSKEPFLELVKGSVKTFVNAMTYPDKTMYPIASRNDKDFVNLMHVYLDAVFYPNIYQNPYILKQEGWRYEVDPKTGELSYNGVVFNEMKGVFSNPEAVLGRTAFHNLFPDTVYGSESGGDPFDIPKLTQEEFLKFHKTFYHPSNSYIYFYGNGNIEEHLKFVNNEYLQNFSKQKVNSTVKFQKAFTTPKEVQEFYSINEKDSPKEKTYFSLNFSIGKSTQIQDYLAFDILTYLLLETPAAPLKRALLDAGIGKDVVGEWENGINQTIFTVNIKNTDPEKLDKFKSVFKSTLQGLVKKGIDKKIIEAALNKKEFILREFDTRNRPKGLAYYGKIMDSWLYDGDPLIHLEFEPTLDKIRKQAMSSRFFENLINKNILNNNHQVLVVLKPKPGLDNEQSEKIKKQLAEFKKTLKPEQLAKIQADEAELKKRQQTPDKPEDVEKIPMLNLSDINPKAEILPIEIIPQNDYKLINHSVFTNKINYLGLYFDLTPLTESQAQYASLVSEMFGKIDTEKYTYEQLSNEFDLHTGGAGYGFAVFSDKNSLQTIMPKLIVKAKALYGKTDKMLELLDQVLLHSKFEDKKRIKEIIQEVKTDIESNIGASGGFTYSSMRVQSYFSKSGKYNELISGLNFYDFVSKLEQDFDKNSDNIIAQLKDTAKLIIHRKNLLVSITNPKEDFTVQQNVFTTFVNKIPTPAAWGNLPELKLSKDNEGLIIPSKVQFVAQGGDFKAAGVEYSGKFLVTRSVLRNDYLWNKVRVQLGAYGAMHDLGRNGLLMLLSYRDPNLKETLDAFSQVPKALENMNFSQREMNKFILGTISALDMPLTPSMKGETSMANYISGITQEDIQKTRDEVLATKIEDVKAYAKVYKKVLDQNLKAVVGGESKINENKDKFGKIISIMK